MYNFIIYTLCTRLHAPSKILLNSLCVLFKHSCLCFHFKISNVVSNDLCICSGAPFLSFLKTASSVLVKHFNMSPDAKVWLTPSCMLILNHITHLVTENTVFTFSLHILSFCCSFFNMSPRVKICMQLLSLLVCMQVIKLPSNRAAKREHTLIYVSRKKYEIELMCC